MQFAKLAELKVYADYKTELKKQAVSGVAIQAALRIAAVVNAVSRVIAAEQALAA